MGMQTVSSQQPSQGKGAVTTPATSGQPQFGQPNQYSNTIQQGGWDNASLGGQALGQSSGKGGKGQSSWQPFQSNWTAPDTSYLGIDNTSQPTVTQNSWESGHGGN